MSPSSDHRPGRRQFVLPSGKSIQIVYVAAEHTRINETAATGSAAVLQAAADEDLHLCGGCGTDLVYPVEWEEAGRQYWEVSLRCPNCEWSGTGVFEQDVVERLDDALDRGTETLVRDLKRLTHANREDEIERFAAALRDDHILPSDF